MLADSPTAGLQVRKRPAAKNCAMSSNERNKDDIKNLIHKCIYNTKLQLVQAMVRRVKVKRKNTKAKEAIAKSA